MSSKLSILDNAGGYDNIICLADGSCSSDLRASDLYGMAVRVACEKLRKRLDGVKCKDETVWADLIMQAYLERVGCDESAAARRPG